MTMKKLLSQVSVSLLVSGAVMTAFAGGPDMPTMVTPGLYMGLGGSWNTVDMTVDTNIQQVAPDALATARQLSVANTKDSQSRLAPMGQLGYWGMIDDTWLWGLVGEYKYLNYNMNTASGNQGVVFPTTVSADTDAFGNLSVNLQHEFMILLYFGATYDKGYFYLGLGPVLFTLNDSVRHYFGGGTTFVGAPATFQSVSGSEVIWGGAAQLGYNYYFNPTWFLGFNYTYTVTGDYSLNNVGTAWHNPGSSASADRDLSFNRSYSFTVQEVMFSINKVFEL